jgi:hypothetical protein
MSQHVNTLFDEHDYQQLKLLAKLNKITMSELMRRIVKAYLDKGKANLVGG